MCCVVMFGRLYATVDQPWESRAGDVRFYFYLWKVLPPMHATRHRTGHAISCHQNRMCIWSSCPTKLFIGNLSHVSAAAPCHLKQPQLNREPFLVWKAHKVKPASPAVILVSLKCFS